MENEKIEVKLVEPGCDRCSKRGWEVIFSCKERAFGDCLYIEQPEIEIHQDEAWPMARLLYDTRTGSWLAYIDNFGIITKMRILHEDAKANHLVMPEKLSLPPSIVAAPDPFDFGDIHDAEKIILSSFVTLIANGSVRVVQSLKIQRDERSFSGKVHGSTKVECIYGLAKPSQDIRENHLGMIEKKILRNLPCLPSNPGEQFEGIDIFEVVRYIFDENLGSPALNLKFMVTRTATEFDLIKAIKKKVKFLFLPFSISTNEWVPGAIQYIEQERKIVEKLVANLETLDPEFLQIMRNKIKHGITASEIRHHSGGPGPR